VVSFLLFLPTIRTAIFYPDAAFAAIIPSSSFTALSSSFIPPPRSSASFYASPIFVFRGKLCTHCSFILIPAYRLPCVIVLFFLTPIKRSDPLSLSPTFLYFELSLFFSVVVRVSLSVPRPFIALGTRGGRTGTAGTPFLWARFKIASFPWVRSWLLLTKACLPIFVFPRLLFISISRLALSF